VVAALAPSEGVAFCTRLDVCRTDLVAALEAVYGDGTDIDGLSERAAHIALAAAAERPEELRLLDRRREVDPQWFR
jgi:amylosucrase